MSRLFYHTMQDNNGNLLFDVSGTMRIAGTSTIATIYGDEAMTVILPNPMTNHPSFGSFKCFLPSGVYDFYMAKAGYTFETLTGVQGFGTMAYQNANAVAITGGTIDSTAIVGGTVTGAQVAGGTLSTTTISGTVANLSSLDVTGVCRFMSQIVVGAGALPLAGANHTAFFTRTGNYGTVYKPTDSDTGTGQPILFHTTGGASVGGIVTTATTTAYNTTSDARLKHAITPLTGALHVVQALRPVRFKWKSDESEGRGFLASEVEEVIADGVITGTRDAVDDEGNIQPQQIDMSKLVPWLCGAVKELAQQVEALTARLAAVGG